MFVTSTVGTAFPAARYTSYEVAPLEAGHISLADVCEGRVAPLAGDVFTTQAGSTTAAAVVNVVVLAAAQVVAAPPAFLGAIYQLYWVAAVRPVAL